VPQDRTAHDAAARWNPPGGDVTGRYSESQHGGLDVGDRADVRGQAAAMFFAR
jgi:hypothetical protein